MASAYNSVGSGLPQVPISMPVSTYHHQTSASPTNYSYNTGSYQAGAQFSYAPNQGSFTQSTGDRRITGATCGGERVESVRKISSTIIEESYLGPLPVDRPTRTIPRETKEEKVVFRPGPKEQREKIVEKRVPQIEYVERVVEHPRTEYNDRVVELPPVVNEVWIDKPVQHVIDRPYDVRKEVKVPKITYTTKDVEVPGQIIECPKPYTVEVPVNINRYTDRQVPMVVAQTIKPYIVEGQGEYEVDVLEYEAECVPVDVHVIKPVATNIEAHGVVESIHRVISVPAAQYNTMLKQLNQHLNATEIQKLPYVAGVGGSVQFLSEVISYTQPQAGVEIQGWDAAMAVNTWTGERVTVSSNATAMHIAGGKQSPTHHESYQFGAVHAGANGVPSSPQYLIQTGGQGAVYSTTTAGPVTTTHTSTTSTTQAGGHYVGLPGNTGQIVTAQPLIPSH